MLKGINQKDLRLLKRIRDYGCLFLCFANKSPVVYKGDSGTNKLNQLYKQAEKLGYISGDLNGDRDYDDEGEAEILDHNGLLSLFHIDAHYDGIHHDATEIPGEDVLFSFGKFFWKSPHFVEIDRDGEVIFDPLDKSNTVRNGTLVSRRFYYAN